MHAIAFASGGINTVMHLGVTHALLVIQGKAPDAVVGVSAGALSATAMADVFQAALGPDSSATPQEAAAMERERQVARTLKFRKILESYQSAPGELARAFFPDMLQVDAQQPLAPLELPIHDRAERDGRGKELTAHQGFIRLFNHLLDLRISFATITRVARRFLGYMAAAEIRSKLGRAAARQFEIARLWSLIAINLPRAAWIAPRLLMPVFTAGKPQDPGATAAGIIFKPQWARAVRIVLRHALLTVLLLLSWSIVTFFVIGLPVVLPHGLEHVIGLFAPGAAAWIGNNTNAMIIGGYGVALGLVLAGTLLTGAWGAIVTFNRSSDSAVLREALWEGLGLLLLFVACLAAIVGVLLGAAVLADGWQRMESLRTALRWAEGTFWIGLAALLITAAAARVAIRGDSFARRLLVRYDLADGLLSTHPVKQLLIRMFDPDYYGGRQMDDVVDRALRDDYSPSRSGSRSKLIRDYETFEPKIALGLMVANLQNGELEIVPPETKVVDGVLAAASVSPLFPPAAIVDKLYLDAANITSEATGGLLTLLRDRVDPGAPVVHMYGVSHLPYSNPELGPPAGRGNAPYLNLLDVTFRALQLQRFRDAALERRMTELYTKVIPPGSAVYQPNGKRYLRVWVAPVEPEAPLELGDRIARCSGEAETRGMMMEAVADGCRAALEVMIRDVSPPGEAVQIRCRTAVERHLARAGTVLLPLLSEPDCDPFVPPPDLFGETNLDEESRNRRGPPGLAEVCSHCTLWRKRPGPASGEGCPPDQAPAMAPKAEPEPEPQPVTLAFKKWQAVAPAWPHERNPLGPPRYPIRAVPPALGDDPHFVRPESEYEAQTRTSLVAIQEKYWAEFTGSSARDRWPLPREGMGPGNQRPVVSFLFSGGVFRGVYQLGSLTALSEAGLAPDVIAGASVGSITGAMVAQAMSAPYGAERDGRIARLAATYLAMDRLILTDRFADFIRGLTLRAAATRFSLRQADRFLRRYDQAGSEAFDNEARIVMAGLERLFWLSPFELKRLVKALRLREYNRVYELLRAYTQEWLDRMGVGNQVLGAEPLTLLILEHVLQRLPTERFTSPELVGFDRYLAESGIFFLATTTNLTRGRLEILGEQQLMAKDRATLLEGLLASSAFPGVFRPRWSWEVMPASTDQHQYIDGGVMDNLPLDAVGHFLRLSSEPDVGIVARRPEHNGQEVPHLLFSASLEIAPEEPSVEQLNRYLAEWPAVLSRAKQLRYNKKLELYAVTQRSIREIWQQAKHDPRAPSITPLDLEVVMVRPRWLCSTFGFHPMLGFRRERQAASIAHGCATALLELARGAKAHPAWAAGWNLDPGKLPPNPPASVKDPIVPERLAQAGDGRKDYCWFRPGIECPYGRDRLDKIGLPQHTQEELHQIHVLCGQQRTHAPNYLEVS